MAATESEMMSPATLGEFGKTASTIKGVEKPKQKKLNRGNSISSLGGMKRTIRDDRSNKSRGSTREGRSKKPGSAAGGSRNTSEIKRNRTLTPSARRTTKPDKFPKPEPISAEEQAIFDEKRE